MTYAEAQRIARSRVQELRVLGYAELHRRFVERSATETIMGESGRPYEVDIEAAVAEDGKLRVVVTVDDQTASASDPQWEDFLVEPS